MKSDALNKLPRYIEAPGGGMWRVGVAAPISEDAVFLRLSDVLALVEKEKETSNAP